MPMFLDFSVDEHFLKGLSRVWPGSIFQKVAIYNYEERIKMKHIYCPNVEGLDSQSLGLDGSAKMIVKLISDYSVCIEIQPDGHTPDHTHNDKERVIVMSGEGEIKLGEGRKNIKPGDFIEFDPDEQHQIINNSDEVLVFMCFRNQK